MSTSSSNHESRSNLDSEMRISISKKHNGTLGESTQVRIVIPSTSTNPSNFKETIGSDSSISSSSASPRNLRECKQKPSSKGTARKTMSSFTPKTQLQMLAKPRSHDLVTIDSGDEDSNCLLDPLSEPNDKDSVTPTLQKSLISFDSNLTSSENKLKNSPGSFASSTTKGNGLSDKIVLNHLKVSDTSIDKDESKRSKTLGVYMELFEIEWKKHMNDVEYAKVKKKLEKRVYGISDYYKNSARLHEFIQMKTTSIVNEPRKVFPVLKEVLDELTKHGHKESALCIQTTTEEPVEKKRIVLTSVLDHDNCSDSSSKPSTSKIGDESFVEDCSAKINSDNHRKLTKALVLKKKRHIHKLERALMTCGKEIRRCEEEELTLSDLEDDDSAYIRASRYKARYLKIYSKIAQLRKLDASLQRKQDKRFRTESSQIPDINVKVEVMVNKHKQFPDYADILKLYKTYYCDNNLVVSKEAMKAEGKI